MGELAANEVRAFGLEPKVAFLSHSHFGASDQPSAVKMREAVQLPSERNPKLEVEGEMQADSALSEPVSSRSFPSSRLTDRKSTRMNSRHSCASRMPSSP